MEGRLGAPPLAQVRFAPEGGSETEPAAVVAVWRERYCRASLKNLSGYKGFPPPSLC